MPWNHFRIFFTPKNALLSGANSPNLNSLERFRRTMPPTANLVASISSQFHHLVNTGLAVGSLVKWLSIKVANPSKIDKVEWFIARRLKMAPSDCNYL